MKMRPKRGKSHEEIVRSKGSESGVTICPSRGVSIRRREAGSVFGSAPAAVTRPCRILHEPGTLKLPIVSGTMSGDNGRRKFCRQATRCPSDRPWDQKSPDKSARSEWRMWRAVLHTSVLLSPHRCTHFGKWRKVKLLNHSRNPDTAMTTVPHMKARYSIFSA